VSKIEKDILREQIDSLFEKMQEEFKEQKIDIVRDLCCWEGLMKKFRHMIS